MNKTEVVFENIEQRILKEIDSAHYAIFVSVAWFTNKRLFKALLDKAINNCYVSIIVQLDDINSQSGINYNEIKIGRSECFFISKDSELLHDKFCVIDFKKVITGSYNWTYKASMNSENIIILSDPSVATQYINRFEQQKAKFEKIPLKESIYELNNQGQRIHQNTTSFIQEPSHESLVSLKPIIKCSHCGCELTHQTPFCNFCGAQIKSSNRIRLVQCKKCKYEQKEPLLDIARTHYCSNCGSLISPTTPFNSQVRETNKTNTNFEQKCPVCQTTYTSGRFCTTCGLALRLIITNNEITSRDKSLKSFQLCSKCGTPNSHGARFCRNCKDELYFQAKDKNGHGWVDLGLSVLWSSESMEGFYLWMDSSTKLSANSKTLDLKYKGNGEDAATKHWGMKWRTPSKEEFEELLNKCVWEKIIDFKSKQHAFKVIGPNGKFIVIPTTGHASMNYHVLPFLKGLPNNNVPEKLECSLWTSTMFEGGKTDLQAYAFRYYNPIKPNLLLTPEQIREEISLNKALFKLESSSINRYKESEGKDLNMIFKENALRIDNAWMSASISSSKRKLIDYLQFCPKCCGLTIRPVADKKWKGLL